MLARLAVIFIVIASPAIAKDHGGPGGHVTGGWGEMRDHFRGNPLTGVYDGRHFHGTIRFHGHNYPASGRLDRTLTYFDVFRMRFEHVKKGSYH